MVGLGDESVDRLVQLPFHVVSPALKFKAAPGTLLRFTGFNIFPMNSRLVVGADHSDCNNTER